MSERFRDINSKDHDGQALLGEVRKGPRTIFNFLLKGGSSAALRSNYPCHPSLTSLSRTQSGGSFQLPSFDRLSVSGSFCYPEGANRPSGLNKHLNPKNLPEATLAKHVAI